MLRQRRATSEEAVAEIGSSEPAADTESVSAILGRITLTGNPELDSLALREEFHIQLIELADRFDHLDHEVGPLGGSELQDDCQAIRQMTRKEMHPRFHEAFRRQQGEILDSRILDGLVAGPDAK